MTTSSPQPEPLIRPPRLHLGREGSASRLELFFDLAYVLVVLELAASFYDDLSWHGLGVLVGLFVALWFSWVGFTLYANRFDTDDVVFRVAKLAATGAIAGCAASASGAVGALAVPFAGCYLLSRLILLALYLRAWRHVPEARRTIAVYLLTVSVSSVLWAVSLGLDGAPRYWLWAVAVLVSAAGPVLAGLRTEQVSVHSEHLPERFALLVILVLGEAVGGAARGVHDTSWAPVPVLVGVLAFVVAAAMWWIYFDVTATSSARELHEDEADGSGDAEDDDDHGADLRHDLFIYAHLPLTLGVVLAGVGLEELVVHPDEHAPSAAGWLLGAGVTVFLVGVALVISGTTWTTRSIWPWPTVALPLVVLAALLPLAGGLLTAVYAIGLLLLAVQGTRASRQPGTVLSGAD